LTFELDIDKLKVDKDAEYLDYTETHTTDRLLYWTTKLGSNERFVSFENQKVSCSSNVVTAAVVINLSNPFL